MARSKVTIFSQLRYRPRATTAACGPEDLRIADLWAQEGRSYVAPLRDDRCPDAKMPSKYLKTCDRQRRSCGPTPMQAAGLGNILKQEARLAMSRLSATGLVELDAFIHRPCRQILNLCASQIPETEQWSSSS